MSFLKNSIKYFCVVFILFSCAPEEKKVVQEIVKVKSVQDVNASVKEEVEKLKGELLKLRKDREEVRSRVERMMRQIEDVAAAS